MSEIMKNTSVVPDGWSIVSLGDVLQYEQPYYYTVTSDDYNDIAGTPVLTAGKSFLLGYSTEVENFIKQPACDNF
jgi:type I restriction enzyme S subunit